MVDQAPVGLSRDGYSVRMKVLFTAPSIGFPPVGGPELRTANSVKALSRLVQLHAFPRRSPSASTTCFLTETCKNVIEDPLAPAPTSKPSIAERTFRRVANRLAPGALSALDARMIAGRTVRRHTDLMVHYVGRHKIDAVWFGYGCISYPLMKSVHHAAPKLPIICDTDSVWSQFIFREIEHEASEARRKAIMRETKAKIAEEERWVNFCDVTTAVCEADAGYYRALAHDPSRIRIFRNAIDMDAYELDIAPPSGHRRPNLVMTGTYYGPHSPMVRAARWVLSEVFPRLRDAMPGLHLYLVGKGSDRYLRDANSADVTVTGTVDSTLPYLKHADVALAALPFEAAGAKFKVLEAAICGVPIVASPNGAEGLPQDCCEYITICETPEQFVSAILKSMHTDDAQRSRLQQFRKRVSMEFGLERLTEDAREILKAVNSSI